MALINEFWPLLKGTIRARVLQWAIRHNTASNLRDALLRVRARVDDIRERIADSIYYTCIIVNMASYAICIAIGYEKV